MWEQRLQRLFEELLEKPLSEFPDNATYAVFHNADPGMIDELASKKGKEPRDPVEAIEWRTSHYPVESVTQTEDDGAVFRLATDGTLADAMATVLHLRAGPSSLFSGAKPEDSVAWLDDQISDDELREHLKAICTVRDSYFEIPGSDELASVVAQHGPPLLSFYTGEGGWFWNVVQVAT